MNNLKYIIPSLLLLTGCATNIPPKAPLIIKNDNIVPQNFPIELAPTVSKYNWQDVFSDESLQSTINIALENNRNLRIAAANIEKANAQLILTNAGRIPSLNTNGNIGVSQTAANNGNNNSSQTYNGNIGLSNYEIDVFGRIKANEAIANENLLAQNENAAALRIGVISQTALAWLAIAYDNQAILSAKKTEATWSKTFKLVEARRNRGLASDLEIVSVRAQLEQIRSDILTLETRLNQDKAILFSIAGNVPDKNLPNGLLPNQIIAQIPTGLSSEILYSRPDILAAEHSLKAANANIEIARLAYFPKLNLTTTAGLATRDLSNLFNSGAFAYNIAAGISAPIFDNGTIKTNYNIAIINQKIALNQYENAIIAAFSENWSALAVRAQIDERIASQSAIVQDATTGLKLSDARFNSGLDSYLPLLVAERTKYTAEQNLINLNYLKAINSIAIYKAIGIDIKK